MKKLLLLLLAVVLATPVLAQKKLYGKNDRAEAIAVGIKAGGNLAQYQYYPDLYRFNELEFDELKDRLHPMFGINVEIPLLRGIVLISPEVLFVTRGDARLFKDGTKHFTDKINYLEARVPVAVALPVSDGFKPYVFVAPTFGWAWQAIQQSPSDTTGVSPYDYGLVLGAGLRFKFDLPGFSMLLKLEGGFYNGLYDTFKNVTYSERVPSDDPNTFNINYSRRNRGFEAAITIAVPLEFHSRGDCFYWAEIEKKKNKSRGAFGF